ncbi:MAG TPA: NAD(P)H-hydrate dehydratase [Caldimonas sp.]|jgi:hydroxyethylthiazole kinase-like uncharacterized protein yjeF|nr:NAD(P)H-hydrate dehydratase [Caldimonas sp.]HEX2542793.1 NAD(P)H-hydrate dehydratase [Caldimonas sp.]
MSGGIERIGSGVGRRGLLSVAATRRLEVRGGAGLDPFALMARAGDAVARLAVALAPHAERVRVYAGPGHNGGDGIEAAVRLRELGKHATVLLVDAAAQPPALVGQALARGAQAGVPVRTFGASSGSTDDEAPDLVIDALLGIGASRAPSGAMSAAIAAIAELSSAGARVLAIDAPSGLDADRGQPLGASCVSAHDTLTLLTLKPGLFTAAGRDHAGEVWFSDLGVDIGTEPAEAWLCGARDPSLQRLSRRHAQHKGSFGDVAVVGGGRGMAGAAWLAARAALAAGAGRVFVDALDPDAAAASLDPVRPELMFRPGWWQGPVDALAGSTVVCGCGAGDAVRAALPRLLSSASRLVLDADALTALATDAALRTLSVARSVRRLATILTPHPLEAARLLGSTTAEVQADRVRSAQAIADGYGAVTVLKGSGTVIAAPGQVARIAAPGNASLASAGTGDVLAGWIGGRWSSSSAGGAVEAVDVATRCVIEHGLAAEPEQPGLIRAADLVEALYRNSRA